MKINIKYPKLKFIEAGNVKELTFELNKLMIVDFEIKRKKSPGNFEKISSLISTHNISDEIFHLLKDENNYIFPHTIAQCKV